MDKLSQEDQVCGNEHSQPELANGDDSNAARVFDIEQTKWSYNTVFKMPSRRECLIQYVGNWRLVKFRKTFDTFECIECLCLLIIEKHPAFCEAKLVHKNQVKKDHSFSEATDEIAQLYHEPYDEIHQRIAGKTHTSLRYFAKKHMLKPATEIVEKMGDEYPMLMKFFKPEVRKIQDIALRERKILGVKPKEPREPKPRPLKQPAEALAQTQNRVLGKYFDVASYMRVQEDIQKTVLSATQIASGQRPGLLGQDEPLRVLQLVQSITELTGYDFLVEWRQPENGHGKIWVSPSIVSGEQLVTEQPYMYRQFIEKKYALNNLQRRL